MSNRRIVYKGPSSIGYVEIREGDYVKGPYDLEGVAFFSKDFTIGGSITLRISNYAYSPNDCHSFEPGSLEKWKRKYAKTKPPKTGFGAFIRKIEKKPRKRKVKDVGELHPASA